MKIANKLILLTCLVAITVRPSFAIFEVGVKGKRTWVNKLEKEAICDNIEGVLNLAGAVGVKKSDVKKLTITDFAMDYLYKKNLITDSNNRDISEKGTFSTILQEYENLETLIIENIIDKYEGDNRAELGGDKATTKAAYDGNFYEIFQNAKQNLNVIIKNINLSETDLKNVKGTFSSKNNTSIQIMSSGLVSVNISGGKSWTESSEKSNLDFSEHSSTLTNFSVNSLNSSIVTSLAFGGCTNLTACSIGSLNASNATSLASMFNGCTSLTTCSINSLNASDATSLTSMFNGCTSLTTCSIDNLNASNVTSLASMFNGCTKLTDCLIPNFNVGAVNNASSMFRNCSSLENLNLETLSLNDVKNASFMFSGCSALIDLDFSSKHFNSVTNTSSMFQSCAALGNLKLGTLNLSGVTNTSNMFDGCGNQQGGIEITFDNFTTRNSVSRELTAKFDDGCIFAPLKTKLKTITIKNLTVNGNNLSSMFKGCINLTNCSIENLNADEVTSLESMFDGCSNLKIYSIPNFNTGELTNVSSMFRNCSSLENLNLETLSLNDVKNASFMFSGCSSLVGLDFSSKHINSVTNTSSMFKDCSVLGTLKFGTLNLSGVTNTSNMFDGCGDQVSGIEITFDNFTTRNSVSKELTAKFDDGCIFAPLKTKLKTITIKNLTVNGNNLSSMFKGCINLTNCSIESLNAAEATSLESMFDGCSNLKTYSIPNFNTGELANVSSMFKDCSALENLNLEALNLAEVKNVSFMFSGCSSLVGLDFSSKHINSVTNTSSMFKDCSVLGTLKFGTLNLSGVTNASNMFDGCGDQVSDIEITFDNFTTRNSVSRELTAKFDDGCMFAPLKTKLKTLTIKNLTVNGNNLSSMFKGCINLTNCSIESLNASESTSLESMFDGCSNLKTYSVVNFNTGVLTNTSGMFNNCASLVDLDLGTVSFSDIQNASSMFSGCPALVALDFSSKHFNSITNTSSMFQNCSALGSLKIGTLNLSGVTNASKMFDVCGNQLSGIEITFDNFISPNSKSKELAAKFDDGCIFAPLKTKLKTITIKNLTVNGNNLSSMFKDCINLTNCSIENLNAAEVTSLESMFDGCSNLKIYSIPNFNTGALTNVSSMFRDCSVLEILKIETLDLKDVKNASYMFSGCSSLIDLDFTPNHFGNVTNTSYMFNSCSALKTLNLGTINLNNVTDVSYMFSDCSALTILDLRTKHLSNITNTSSMFKNCSALRVLKLGTLNLTGVTKASNMFDGCGDQENGIKITFDNLITQDSRAGELAAKFKNDCMFYPLSTKIKKFSVKNFTVNGDNLSAMFKNCSALNRVKLGKIIAREVTNIARMFAGCGSLTSFCWDTSIGNIPLTGTLTNTSKMFRDCYSLEASFLKYLQYLSTKDVTNMKSMFEGCSGMLNQSDWIEYLKLFNTSSAIDMSGMFKNSGLNTLEFLQDGSSFNTDNVTNMSGMFEGTGITDTNINNNNNGIKFLKTNGVRNMSNMFKNCRNILGEVFFPSQFVTDSVTNMGGMFQGCPGIILLDLSHFNTKIVTNMNDMFNGDSKLTTVIIGANFVVDDAGKGTTAMTGFLDGANTYEGGNGQVNFKTNLKDEYNNPLYDDAFKDRIKEQQDQADQQQEVVFDEGVAHQEMSGDGQVIVKYENGAVVEKGEKIEFLKSEIVQVAGNTEDIDASDLSDENYTKDLRIKVGGTLTGAPDKQAMIYGPVTREHAGIDWIETEADSSIYYPAQLPDRGTVKRVKADGLRELYGNDYLNRLYRNVARTDGGKTSKLAKTDTARLTVAMAEEINPIDVENGELPLSSRIEYEAEEKYVAPGTTFAIDCSNDKDINNDVPANIEANLSNSFEQDKGAVPATNLQIISGDKKIILSGDNSELVAPLTIGDETSEKANLIVGSEGIPDSSKKALGQITTIDAYNGSSLLLLGSDPIDVEHNWTFHGASKIDSNGKLIIHENVVFTLGAPQ